MRNWQKKLTYILIISVIIGTYLKLKSSNSAKVPHSSAEVKVPNPQKNAVLLRKRNVGLIKARDCLVESGLEGLPSIEELQRVTPAWENIHFKKDGEIFRLREFNDDGPNGDIRKLILYKEDQDEFAHIVKIWESGDFKSMRRELLKNSEQIHKEVAILLTVQQKSAFIEILNSRLNRLEINNISILPSCSK